MFETVVVIDHAEGFVRNPQLYFVDGKLMQSEQNGMEETRFVDVTEDVAKALAPYLQK